MENQEAPDKIKTIEEFNWDDSGFDFTGPEVVEKEEKPDVPEEEFKFGTVEEVEEVPDEDEEQEEEKEEEQEEPEDEYEEEKKFFANLGKDLYEQGIFTEEIPEDFDRSKFFEKWEKETENRVNQEIRDFADSFDEDAKAFINFKRNGGRTADFFATRSRARTDNFDISNEEGQEQFLKYVLSREGDTDLIIQDKLERWKDNDKIKSFSEDYYKKMKRIEEQEDRALMESQTKAREAREEQRRMFKNNVLETVEKVDEVGDIPITKRDKRILPDYILRPSVRQGDKYVSPMTAALNTIYRDHPEKLLALAKIIQADFKIPEVKTKAETEVTKKTKTNLERVKKAPAKPKAKKRALWDFDF